MWTERHRPQTLDAVATAANAALVSRIKADPGATPHLLLHGGAGTGKTSFALALRNRLFADAHRDAWCKMVNASDKRGIDVVRGEIVEFCESAGMFTTAATATYPFKLLILDEADSMTPDAQRDLKNKVEAYSGNVRFVFIGNVVSKIIDALHSRCTVVRFTPLPRTVATAHLASVASAEGLALGPDVVDCVVDFAKGDMRKSVQVLQMLSRLPPPHTANQFWDCVGRPSPSAVVALVAELRAAPTPKAAFDTFRTATRKYMAVDVLGAAVDAGMFSSAASLKRAADLEVRLLAEGGAVADAHAAAFVGLLLTQSRTF